MLELVIMTKRSIFFNCFGSQLIDALIPFASDTMSTKLKIF